MLFIYFSLQKCKILLLCIMKKKSPPSVKLWWLVKNSSKQKRWLVKNLKQFIKENNPYNSHDRWYDLDVDSLYRDMVGSYGYARDWSVTKPTVEQLRNITGSDNPKVGRTYQKELPYGQKKYIEMIDHGSSQTVKQFWGDIEFSL